MKTPDILNFKIQDYSYNASICYQPESENNPYYEDIILFTSKNKTISEFKTKLSLTVGRISNLVREKSSKRFISLSYDAGEFCNGIVIFDIKQNKIAFEQQCKRQTEICHIKSILDRACQATITCNEMESEENPSAKKNRNT